MRRRFENIKTVVGGQLSAARSLFLLVRFRPLQPHGENLYLFLVVDTDLMEQLWRLPMF